MGHGKSQRTRPEYREPFASGTRFRPKRLIVPLAAMLPLAWFAITYLVLRPLANGPVVDSWIYLRAVKNLRTGVFAIPGFTAALPLAQIAYGALWSRLFGLSYPALDLSVASLGLVGSILFYWLARNCGADGVGAATGTALLIANPCYLFLSFSFMTDVPFVAALIAAHFMFANAERGRTPAWMWSCAGCLVVAFLVRPFALAAIAGCAGAIIMTRVTVGRVKLDARLIVPFVAALIVCIATWWWMTAMRPMPWMLELRGHKLSYVHLVPLRVYFIDAIIAPLLYLGLVLSPLALPHLFCPRWRTGLAVALGLAVVALPLLPMDPGTNSIPELSCCGGWTNALVLRGPLRFVWTDQWIRTAVIVLGILGAAGMVLAALEIQPGALSPSCSARRFTGVARFHYGCSTTAITS